MSTKLTGVIDAVTRVLFEAAETAVRPRFRSLAEADVVEKAPGEMVTVADQEAEDLITAGLRQILDVPVVGEEAVAEDPALLSALSTEPSVWLVDPLDGTANFIAGSPEYAVMAALVRAGETVAAWIVLPESGLAYVAERGSGAFEGGRRIQMSPARTAAARLRGVAPTRFLDPAARTRLATAAEGFASLGPGSSCAGVDYSRQLDGELDFSLFHRTLPWDHAPGALLLTEAGGLSRRPDGSSFRLSDNRFGLLNAANADCWNTVRALLVGGAAEREPASSARPTPR
ncbi:inositol monophosphatase family protein [Nocardia salmonicida]|uniref:inositol monophosphatase family protein n=1 Tax=Nocardia salmonicida TaxID=53431 RepID=UPI00365047A9